MSNERLRAAISGAGLSLAEFGDRVGVDPKTVERWITKDRVPHRTHRLSAAKVLGQDEVFLWPTTLSDLRTASASQAEFVALHPNRGAMSANDWAALIDQAVEAIDVLAYSASFLHDSVPDFGQSLAEKARQGVQVRLLFADPDSEAVRVRGDEEGIGDLLAARTRLTWTYLKPILDEQGIFARQHGCTVYNSIFRFDDDLLANTHTFGAAASHSPLLHIHRIPGGRLFTQYMQSFDKTWARAAEVRQGTLA